MSNDITPDTVAPVITITIDGVAVSNGDTHSFVMGDAAVLSTSSDDGSAVAGPSSIDTSTVGSSQYTYSSVDAAGNRSEIVFTVVVSAADTTAPVIGLSIDGVASTSVSQTLEVGFTSFTLGAALNEAGTLMSVVGGGSSTPVAYSGPYTIGGSAFGIGEYTWTFSGSDDAGNAADAVTYTLNVVAAPAQDPTDLGWQNSGSTTGGEDTNIRNNGGSTSTFSIEGSVRGTTLLEAQNWANANLAAGTTWDIRERTVQPRIKDITAVVQPQTWVVSGTADANAPAVRTRNNEVTAAQTAVAHDDLVTTDTHSYTTPSGSTGGGGAITGTITYDNVASGGGDPVAELTVLDSVVGPDGSAITVTNGAFDFAGAGEYVLTFDPVIGRNFTVTVNITAGGNLTLVLTATSYTLNN